MANIGAIFDCDGVLIDSTAAWIHAEARVADLGNIELSAADADFLNACTVEEAARWFHNERGVFESEEAVVRTIDEFMVDFYGAQAEALPGAIDFVRSLSAAGVPLAVVSSSPTRYLELGLEHCGLAPYFDYVVSSEAMGMTKREPDVFKHALDLLGTDAAATWVFDDSYYALETARSLGLRTIGVYSNDVSGAHEQLAARAEQVIEGLGEFAPESLLNA